MESKKHVLWKLFVSTLYLSAFTFGGGYVIVTLLNPILVMVLAGVAKLALGVAEKLIL